MKKYLSLSLLIVSSICLSGCTNNVFEELEYKDCYIFNERNLNDIENIDNFEKYLQEHYENYIDLKQNVPDVIDYAKDITPKDLKKVCNIFKFPFLELGFLSGMTYLYYENNYYPLGGSLGGYGVSQIVFLNNTKDKTHELYYLYSYGSGIHQTSIGRFVFEKKRNDVIYHNDDYENDFCIVYSTDENFLLDLNYAHLSYSTNKYFIDVIATETAILQGIENL